MSRIVRDLARRLTAAGVDPFALTALVGDMAAARAEAINCEGAEAQIVFLLETYGPDEIEGLVFHSREGQP